MMLLGNKQQSQVTCIKRQETRDKQPLSRASTLFCRSDKDRRDASDKATNLVAFFATCDLRLERPYRVFAVPVLRGLIEARECCIHFRGCRDQFDKSGLVFAVVHIAYSATTHISRKGFRESSCLV